jgi:hypothetical protein
MENKTGKYFKYAIGEILLVMVGIILALQVNNWNEERKDKNLKQTFLIKLKSNLQDDILRFNEVSGSNEKYIMHIDSAMLILNNYKNYTTTDLQKHLKFLIYSSRFNTNKIAFDNLLSLGKINVIDNDSITESLFAYYRNIQNNKEAVTEGMDAYNRNTYGPALLEFDFLNNSEIFIPRDLNAYVKHPFIINSLELKKQMLTYFYEQNQGQKSNALGIVKLIDEELNK